MAPPKGIQNVLDKFKADFARNEKVKIDSAKARDEKLAKKKKKPAASTQAVRKKTATKASSGTSTQQKSAQDQANTKWMNDASRDLPLGLRQKMVIDFLRGRESPSSWEEILNGTGRNIESEADLKSALDAHPKVAATSGTYAYVPDANIKNKQQLLDYVRASAEPVAVVDLLDSYKKVKDDIEALKEERLLVGLFSYLPELNCEVLYSTVGNGKMSGKRLTDLRSDEEVTALWTNFTVPDSVGILTRHDDSHSERRAVRMFRPSGSLDLSLSGSLTLVPSPVPFARPQDEALDDALRKAGIAPAPRKEKPKKLVSEKKKKKRKQSKLRSVTNAHLLHLLEGDAVVSIDD
jgi:hypothetical protein